MTLFNLAEQYEQWADIQGGPSLEEPLFHHLLAVGLWAKSLTFSTFSLFSPWNDLIKFVF